MKKCKECSEEELPAVYCSYSKEFSLVEKVDVLVYDDRPIPDDQKPESEEPSLCDPYKIRIGDLHIRIEEDVYNRLKEINNKQKYER